MPQVSGSEPLMSKEDTCKLQEEEDIALQVTHLGIMAQTSDGAEFQNSFSKIVIEAEDIFNLEIFNLAPYILSGKLEITLQDDRTLSFVNEISVGELVKASVSEFSPSPEPEANKAFLVMARSRAIAGKEMRRHASDSFDLCNTYHCLEFNGLGGIRDLIRILDRMVPNEVMIANGKVVFPHFQECCGGKISSMKNIYGIDDPVHQAIDDRIAGKGAENCFHSPSFRWTREFLQEEMADFLAVSYAGGSSHVFLRWDPIKTDPTERITEVRLVGKRKLKLSGTEFLQTSWEHFGVNALKSMCFTLEPMRRATIFRGKGRGLGVGLCLYGADGLAKKNFNYQDILKFYYSGIHLERDHQPVADAPQIQGSKSSGAK